MILPKNLDLVFELRGNMLQYGMYSIVVMLNDHKNHSMEKLACDIAFLMICF